MFCLEIGTKGYYALSSVPGLQRCDQTMLLKTKNIFAFLSLKERIFFFFSENERNSFDSDRKSCHLTFLSLRANQSFLFITTELKREVEIQVCFLERFLRGKNTNLGTNFNAKIPI